MAQFTVRLDDDLAEAVKRSARADGASLNAWVTSVLRLTVDPTYDPEPDEERLKERLRRAGILAEATRGPAPRPAAGLVARARAEAGRGRALSDFIADGRTPR